MTAKANHSTPATTCSTPLVLFGLDSRGKSKGARFGKEHADLAVKAASQLQLQVLAGNDPKIAEIVARLPVGRVHVAGRTFVPFIRRDLYDRLVAAANGNLAQPPAPPASGASGNAAGSRPPGSSPKLPRNWQEIGVGVWSLRRIVLRTAGTTPSSSRSTATCSHYSGAITRASGGLSGIGCGSPCSIRDPNRAERLANRRKPQAAQNTTRQSKRITPPTAWRSPKIGMRLISIISCWPRPKARGRTGSRPYRLSELATASNCVGAIMSRCRQPSGHGSIWRSSAQTLRDRKT